MSLLTKCKKFTGFGGKWWGEVSNSKLLLEKSRLAMSTSKTGYFAWVCQNLKEELSFPVQTHCYSDVFI